MKSGTLWSLRLKFTNCVPIGHERNWISLDLDLDTGERLYEASCLMLPSYKVKVGIFIRILGTYF